MKTKFNLLVLFVLLGVMILSACGAGAAATEAPAAAEAPAFIIEEPAVAQDAGEGDIAKEESAPSSDLAVGPVYDTGASPDNAAAFAATHMIIKNADVKLLVEDTDIAIDRATQAIGDMNGYIISSRVWYQPLIRSNPCSNRFMMI